MKNIYSMIVLLALLLLPVTACVDTYPEITDPDGNPIDSPGMGNILPDGLPEDVKVNITDANGNHRYKVLPGISFNLNAGNWQAIAYSNASMLGETSAGIINLPVDAGGKVSQPEFSAGVVAFTIVEDELTDIRLHSFQPMTRQLIIPFSFPEVNHEQINSVVLRIKNVVTAVDVSKGFGYPATVNADCYVESAGVFAVPSQLSGLADGVVVFHLPAVPNDTSDYLTAELDVDIKNVGAYHAFPDIPRIAAEFNAGPAASPYFTGIIEVYLTPGGIETEIWDWEKEPGIEIPGI